MLRTHLLTAEWKQAFPHSSSQGVHERHSLTTGCLDQLILDDLRGDHEDDLPPIHRVVVAAEGGAEQRNVSEERNLTVLNGRLLLKQTTQNQGFTVSNLHVRRDFVGELIRHFDLISESTVSDLPQFGAGDARIDLHPNGVIL